MLTGRVPFSGATPVATAFQHAFSAPPSISQLHPAISPEIEDVVMKAIAKKPEQRYESASQLVQALYTTASGTPPTYVDNGYMKIEGDRLTPMILASTGTIPEVLDTSAHEAPTVVDILKTVGGRTSPMSPLPFSSTPVHSTSVPRQRNKHRRLRVAALSIILILLLIIGGSAAYLYIAQLAHNGHSVAHISRTGSPVSQATSIISVHLPPPEIQAGNLLYGTPLPGSLCDSSSASWSKTDNAHVLCGTSTTELSDTNSHHLAAAFLNTLPSGQSIPNDYILQVQVRQGPHSHGAFGILFRNQPNAASMGAYAFWLYPNNSWSSNVYDEITRTETELYRHQTLGQLNGVVTIDIRVHGDTFNLFVNGREQGYATSGKYPSGTIGLAVNPEANVFFSNFALYALPKR
jgi:serine/threonine protein kinase